jgi:2'-5' RNA ligase
MNLKKKIREALLEKQKRVYDYGCVMINLSLDEKEWNHIQEMIDEDDIYFGTEEDTGYGRELDPHVTALYGIHADVPDEDVEEVINGFIKPEVKLQKISAFKNEKFDVLKFDVESPDMHGMNEMLKELPYTTEYPNYHPHATICYLKNGAADKYIKKLSDIEPIIVTPDTVVYSKPDGSKKKYKL